jgi:deoxyribose-phosphate aldolase
MQAGWKKLALSKNNTLKGQVEFMAIDQKTIETLVEIITREVLVSLEEAEYRELHPDSLCKMACVDHLCVHTCFDRVGQVVSAGADRLSSFLGVIPKDLNIAGMIDHTLLKPDATADQIAQLCFEAKKYHFASVCVNPSHVKLCSDLLNGSPVKVCTVIGFPLGANSTEVKSFEAQNALQNGASEIDMVINIGALKARDLELAARDIRAIVKISHEAGAIIKVIIETALLTDEEKTIACLLSKEAGADFVKTSTGFASGGATAEDVTLMRKVVGPEMGIKAAGGIRTREDVEKLVKAGATRIGASAGVKIIQTINPSSIPAEAVSKGY